MSTTLTQRLLPSNDIESNNGHIDEEKTERENNNLPQQPEETETMIENSKDTQKMQQAVIKEETINTTTKLIIGSLGWTNAALLYKTLENTIYIEDWSDLSNSWLIFSVSLILALIVIMIPLCCWIDVKSDQFQKQFLTNNNNDIENDDNFFDDKRPFASKFEYLLLAATSFVVSMTMRDATKLTFQQKIIETNNIESATYIVYAMIWTIIGVWITIHLTNKQNKYKTNIIEHGVIDIAIDSSILTHFAIKQIYISLIILTITYIMAWSWRTAIDSFILSMYGGDKLTTAHVWIYCIIVSVSIAFMVAISDHFYCLYPKEIPAQNLFTKSRTVEETNKLVYSNCQFVVGFSWHAAIRVTVFYYATDSIVFNVFVLYWTVAITMVFLSIYFTHKFTQQKIQRKIDAIGFGKLMQSVVSIGKNKTNEIKAMTYTRYEVPRLCNTFGITILSLTIECWSIAGSLFIGDAVSYSILAIYYSVGEYNIEMEYEHITTGLWLQWTVVVVTLGLTALIMLYLRNVMMLFRDKTHALSNKIKNLITQIHHK
eukprot:122683_1